MAGSRTGQLLGLANNQYDRDTNRAWVWLLCRDWLTWEVGDLAGWVATLPRGCSWEAAMGLVLGPLEAAGRGGTGAGGTDYRAKSGPIQPRGSQRR